MYSLKDSKIMKSYNNNRQHERKELVRTAFTVSGALVLVFALIHVFCGALQ